MAQTRFHNYKRPVVSFDENQRLMGIVKSGRYAGFDTMTAVAGLNFEIAHTKTGVQKVKQDMSLTTKTGVFITPQGTIVNEDANIALSVDTNAGNAQIRVDLVIYTHNHVAVTGGSAAVPSIVKGALNSFTKPALPNAATQTIIGIILIPAGATDLTTATYLPSTHPDERRKRPELYSGSVADIPAGKVLCNGVGYDTDLTQIPNLSGKFIVGYDAGDADYNAQGNAGPVAPVDANDYQLINGGKKVKQGTNAVGYHFHVVKGGIHGGGAGSNIVTQNGASPYLVHEDFLTTTALNDNLSEKTGYANVAAMENRPPYYTLAYIIAV